MEAEIAIGEQMYVLLPYYVQVTDDIGPYVHADVISVKSDEIQVEYDTPYGKRDLWLEKKNLDCYFVDDED